MGDKQIYEQIFRLKMSLVAALLLVISLLVLSYVFFGGKDSGRASQGSETGLPARPERIFDVSSSGLFSLRALRNPDDLEVYKNDILAYAQSKTAAVFESVDPSVPVESEWTSRLILLLDRVIETTSTANLSCDYLKQVSTDSRWIAACEKHVPEMFNSLGYILIALDEKKINLGELFRQFRESVDKGAQSDQMSAVSSVELRAATELLTVRLNLTGPLSKNMNMGVAQQLHTQLVQAESALAREWRTSQSTTVFFELIQFLASGRHQYARMAGYDSYAQYVLRRSAMQLFEDAKGRRLQVKTITEQVNLDAGDESRLGARIEPMDPAFDPVGRFLRATYNKVVVEGLREALAFTEAQQAKISRDLRNEKGPSVVLLRSAFSGLTMVVKAVLNFDMEVDHEQSLWSDTSVVFKVSRGGQLYGRIFYEVAMPSVTLAVASPAKCRTRTHGEAFSLVRLAERYGMERIEKKEEKVTVEDHKIVEDHNVAAGHQGVEDHPAVEDGQTVPTESIKGAASDEGDPGAATNLGSTESIEASETIQASTETIQASTGSSQVPVETSEGPVETKAGARANRSSVLDEFRVSQRYVQALFHETGHALHCILGEVSLHMSTLGQSTVPDFTELPAHLFEHFAVEWLKYLVESSKAGKEPSAGKESSAGKVQPVAAGKEQSADREQSASFLSDRSPVRDQKQPEVVPTTETVAMTEIVPVIEVHTFKALLFAAIFVHHINSGPKGTVKDLIEEKVTGAGPASYNAGASFIADHSTNAFSYVTSHVISAMIHHHGDYSSRLRTVFAAFDPSSSTGSVQLTSEGLVNPVSVPALANEEGIRKFFAGGAFNPLFSQFFAIVPGFEKKLDHVDFLEDSIDFAPLIAELQQPSVLGGRSD